MKKIKKLLKTLGPGFITGASGDDPSGIASYSQTGARFGYGLLWTTLFTFPFMTVIQEICGRIGMVTGRGLSGVIREHYPRSILHITVFFLFIANVINIGANLGAMAASVKLLVDLPYIFLLLSVTGISLLLQVFIPYRTYTSVLKFFAFTLLAYIAAGFIVGQQWREVALATFIPQIIWREDYLLTIVAILGTTISPYLFFWQAGQEVEEAVFKRKILRMGLGIPRISKGDIHEMRIDTIVGMFFSQVVTFFIIITAASTLHVNGITTIETADQAASALRPVAGDFAFLLFALGIIGTGMLSVPILAGSASYATSEAFG